MGKYGETTFLESPQGPIMCLDMAHVKGEKITLDMTHTHVDATSPDYSDTIFKRCKTFEAWNEPSKGMMIMFRMPKLDPIVFTKADDFSCRKSAFEMILPSPLVKLFTKSRRPRETSQMFYLVSLSLKKKLHKILIDREKEKLLMKQLCTEEILDQNNKTVTDLKKLGAKQLAATSSFLQSVFLDLFGTRDVPGWESVKVISDQHEPGKRPRRFGLVLEISFGEDKKYRNLLN